MNPKELKLIRLLVGVIAIIILLFLLFILLAIPSVNYYKKQNTTHLEVKEKFETVRQNHEETVQTLKELKTKNKNKVDAFANSFDENSFMRYMQDIFDKVEFSKEEPLQEDKFVRYKIKVTTSMQTPMKFYRFLSDVNRYSNILEAEFPIEFEMVDGNLTGSFELKKYHYEIKTK